MIFGVLHGLAEAHVEHDLLEARHLERVREAELLHQRGHDLVGVLALADAECMSAMARIL